MHTNQKISGFIGLLIAGGILVGMLWFYAFPEACDPPTAERQLPAMEGKGIRAVTHPPSQSNLLWVHVDHQWYRLSEDEKRSLDRIVRCAARTIDAQGRPTWQAAYYDHTSGQLVALTSRKWGFRLKDQESHFAQEFPDP